MFDRLISLGLDCEPIVQLRRLTGRAEPQVLDWHKLYQPGLLRLLRTDFEGYFERANLVLADDRSYVLDTSNGLEFHHMFTVDLDGKIAPQRLDREYPRVASRQTYLLRCWRERVASSQSVLYVRRDPYDLFTLADLVDLRDALRESYPGHRFALLWVRDPQARGAGQLGEDIHLIDDGIYVAEMPVVQPRSEHWQGDDAAWDRLYLRMRQLAPPERLELNLQ